MKTIKLAISLAYNDFAAFIWTIAYVAVVGAAGISVKLERIFKKGTRK